MKHLPEAPTMSVRPIPCPWLGDGNWWAERPNREARERLALAELAALLREQDEEREGDEGEPREFDEGGAL